MRVLYDGWPLVFKPNSPAGLHLLAVLAHLPEPVRPVAALPGPAPVWLPERVARLEQDLPGSPEARAHWEQRILPRLARQSEAELLHLTTPGPALFTRAHAVFSPAAFNLPWAARAGGSEMGQRAGLLARWRQALGRGALSRLAALLWPDDLPEPQGVGRVLRMAPLPDSFVTHLPSGSAPEGVPEAAPNSYVLYHGPVDEYSLDLLAASWSWAAGPLGESTPLFLLRSGSPDEGSFSLRLEEHNLQDTVRILPALEPAAIPALYRNCAALIHLGPEPPWGGPVRRALAAGRPVVAAEHPLVEAVVGPAGYLSPMDEARSLGAALITVVGEESISTQLVEAARQRAASWDPERFTGQLWNAYQTAAG